MMYPFEALFSGSAMLFVILLLHCASTTSSTTHVYNIHWNSSNPIFKTNHVIDINGGNHPWEYDQVNIVCPFYEPTSAVDVAVEKYIIYSVSKDEYQSCRISQPSPKIVAICDRPHEVRYFTITFRSFTPTPGGLEFTPGHNYYFISTSSRSDLHRRVGGGCSTHNMKVMFRVAPSHPLENKSQDGGGGLKHEGGLEVSQKPHQSSAVLTHRVFPWSNFSRSMLPGRRSDFYELEQPRRPRKKTTDPDYGSTRAVAESQNSPSSTSALSQVSISALLTLSSVVVLITSLRT